MRRIVLLSLLLLGVLVLALIGLRPRRQRFAPLRDAAGAYRGMMETMQDISDIVGLEGAQLTLDWD